VQLGEPTKAPGPDTIDAVAVCGPESIVPPRALTVIVSTWFAPISFAAAAGVMLMFASTQLFDAFPLPPGPGFEAVVRGTTWPETGMFAVACMTVVPTVEAVIVIVQLAVAPPPV
jgi:hypothetical protein